MVADVDAPHILVIDDDDRIRDLLRKFLSKEGFLVTTADHAEQARERMDVFEFDLLILDVMMPGETGVAFATRLRESSDVPILMLTAMSESEDRISGLESGVDDYLTKPFEPRELLLRVNAILRRRRRTAPITAMTALTLGAYTYDPQRVELTGPDGLVRLSTAEIELLKAFAAQPGATLSRDELARLTGSTANPRTVDVQVTRLRKKIEPDPRQPRYLQTVRGRGYALKPD